MSRESEAFNSFTGRGVRITLRRGKELERLIGRASSEVIRRLQLRMMQTLTSATPVDTGFARGGWTPSVGSPVVDKLDRPTSETDARSRASKNLATNRAKAEAIANTYKISQGPAFITNAVPYIVFLDQGSSAQAPSNFVTRAIQAAIASVGSS